ncbi:hypothetical protein [Saccharopolyspora mangrovi]|uniref:MarR family transcriptional regulator n=1 Tax=Saccharopolyspora mangrovi TaxID=3082379 RepID=A0ABU6AEM2_9PSEU|nr:hypothetical protein [Saccharopolyspora sp. S2-29]MEB3369999.1 hypothetical protein [Saccharopolyspora sp. S2-29]
MADPKNRRVRRSTLTDAGLDLINRMVSAHLENERMLLSNLSGDERHP